MSHKALARKYRPRRFSDVSTQEHVSETLRRSVASDRVGHAYLLCGPRGIGKTTLARVLAMALNCPDREEDGEPCGECDSCQRIWAGRTSLDVVEIDAASNRGVDDARDLRERAMYAPSQAGGYKVYIIDEAHMLTREAWNALLKILEEPPPRVIFVFATTEPQKIQQTAAPILSRCQRFDLHRIGVSDIVDRLRAISDSEGVSAPEEALALIARRAQGGMRDALSLLDQVVSLTGGDITHDSVRHVLGLVEEEQYLELLDILAERRHSDVFSFVERLLDGGYDLAEFYRGLVDTIRGALRTLLDGPDAAPVRPELRDEFVLRAGRFSAGDLVRMLAMAAELETTGSLRRSGQPRVLLELLLLRFSYLDRTVEVEELLRSLGAGGSAPSGGTGSDQKPLEASAQDSEFQSELSVSGQTRRPGPVEEQAEARPKASVEAQAEAQPEAPAEAQAERQAEAQGVAQAVAQVPPRVQAGACTVIEAWRRLLDGGKGIPAGLGLFLRSAEVTETHSGGLHLALPVGPGLEKLSGPVALNALAEALAVTLGRTPELTVSAPNSPPQGVGAPRRISQETVRGDRTRALLELEPLLRPAVEELDLELLD